MEDASTEMAAANEIAQQLVVKIDFFMTAIDNDLSPSLKSIKASIEGFNDQLEPLKALLDPDTVAFLADAIRTLADEAGRKLQDEVKKVAELNEKGHTACDEVVQYNSALKKAKEAFDKLQSELQEKSNAADNARQVEALAVEEQMTSLQAQEDKLKSEWSRLAAASDNLSKSQEAYDKSEKSLQGQLKQVKADKERALNKRDEALGKISALEDKLSVIQSSASTAGSAELVLARVAGKEEAEAKQKTQLDMAKEVVAEYGRGTLDQVNAAKEEVKAKEEEVKAKEQEFKAKEQELVNLHVEFDRVKAERALIKKQKDDLQRQVEASGVNHRAELHDAKQELHKAHKEATETMFAGTKLITETQQGMIYDEVNKLQAVRTGIGHVGNRLAFQIHDTVEQATAHQKARLDGIAQSFEAGSMRVFYDIRNSLQNSIGRMTTNLKVILDAAQQLLDTKQAVEERSAEATGELRKDLATTFNEAVDKFAGVQQTFLANSQSLYNAFFEEEGGILAKLKYEAANAVALGGLQDQMSGLRGLPDQMRELQGLPEQMRGLQDLQDQMQGLPTLFNALLAQAQAQAPSEEQAKADCDTIERLEREKADAIRNMEAAQQKIPQSTLSPAHPSEPTPRQRRPQYKGSLRGFAYEDLDDPTGGPGGFRLPIAERVLRGQGNLLDPSASTPALTPYVPGSSPNPLDDPKNPRQPRTFSGDELTASPAGTPTPRASTGVPQRAPYVTPSGAPKPLGKRKRNPVSADQFEPPAEQETPSVPTPQRPRPFPKLKMFVQESEGSRSPLQYGKDVFAKMTGTWKGKGREAPPGGTSPSQGQQPPQLPATDDDPERPVDEDEQEDEPEQRDTRVFNQVHPEHSHLYTNLESAYWHTIYQAIDLPEDWNDELDWQLRFDIHRWTSTKSGTRDLLARLNKAVQRIPIKGDKAYYPPNCFAARACKQEDGIFADAVSLRCQHCKNHGGLQKRFKNIDKHRVGHLCWTVIAFKNPDFSNDAVDNTSTRNVRDTTTTASQRSSKASRPSIDATPSQVQAEDAAFEAALGFRVSNGKRWILYPRLNDGPAE